MQIPDALPVLSAGHHEWGTGKACAMDAVSFIYGRPEEGDAPSCVYPLLRAVFIHANDSLPDSKRHELWPLILRAMGSNDRAPGDVGARVALDVALAEYAAEYAAYAANDAAKYAAKYAANAAEYAAEYAAKYAVNAAKYAAKYAVNAANAAEYAANAEYAEYAANAANAAENAAKYAAYAAEYAAYAAKHAADAAKHAADAAKHAADAAKHAAYAHLAFVASMLDEFDRLTAPQAETVAVPWVELVEVLGSA